MKRKPVLPVLFCSVLAVSTNNLFGEPPLREISGVYPHLTMYNQEGECGTGAVVPWADRLWVITYGPHLPEGSSDKLYEITPSLQRTIRPESVGGTPANRMIHRESKQLNIGPYLIDADRNVRVLSPKRMPGRLTGTARHLTDPTNKLYIATMEEGLYSVDVHTLEIIEHMKDGNRQPRVAQGLDSKLPGYHGKGLYSGQRMLVYANNGTRGQIQDPTITSGALAKWRGEGDWQLIRENQFTEVTGPGGIHGNDDPDRDPIWSLGWDYKSLILMLLDNGQWHAYRLPKGSHSYDGSHGWNTEWPRIRDIGEGELLATMHGTFWRFPKTFSAADSAGIAPRANYLKVIGDFARWNDRIVLGCDDSAQKEFLNKRSFKAERASPVQSNSNLWFVEPNQIDELGPVIGRGSVWLREHVAAGQVSEPYLFDGYDHRMLVIRHDNDSPVTFELEVDRAGNGHWEPLRTLVVDGSRLVIFDTNERAAWIRLRPQQKVANASVHFHYRNRDHRVAENDAKFAPICRVGERPDTSGRVRGNRQVLSLRTDVGDYALNDLLELVPMKTETNVFEKIEQPTTGISVDAASAIIEEDGKRYRIPKDEAYANDTGRICREVATERDLFNFHGTFYELPARNAQGFAKIRPVATHRLAIDDYASQFGLLLMTGLNKQTNDRVIRSEDGKAAVWAGVIDDLWSLGKPRGVGGPWKDSNVKANVASDPYLMTGYDRKSLRLETDQEARVVVEIDIDGTGVWVPYDRFEVTPQQPLVHEFPDGFSAYWVRLTLDQNCRATGSFIYE
ncbi:MAG: hypothetical protein R3C05_14935 [Pirellulaceae bacterium]